MDVCINNTQIIPIYVTPFLEFVYLDILIIYRIKRVEIIILIV